MSEFEGERIAKVIARAGVCSRREAEQLILDGHVTLNHKVLKTAAINVTDADQIRINGKPLPQKEESKLWRYHKPEGLVVSHKDPQGRPSVFDKLATAIAARRVHRPARYQHGRPAAAHQ